MRFVSFSTFLTIMCGTILSYAEEDFSESELISDTDRYQRNNPSQMNTRPQQPNNRSQSNNRYQNNGYNKPTTDDESSLYGVTVSGSYLYWIAREDGLEYALTGLENTLGEPPAYRGTTYRPHFRYDSGFRVEAGYQYKNRWDLDACWTRYTTVATSSVTGTSYSENTTPEPIWSIWAESAGAGASVNYAEATWDLGYSTYELMTGILFNMYDFITFKPSIGLIGATINQSYDVFYQSGEPTGYSHFVNMENNFAGIGFRGTFKVNWDVNRYFGFFAKGGASVLAGSFFIVEEQSNQRPFYEDLSLGGNFLSVAQKPKSIKSEIDFCAGVHVAYPFMPTAPLMLKLDIGWDMIVWIDQNQMMRFVGMDYLANGQTFRGQYLPQHGDLMLQGLNVTLGLEF